MKRRHDLSGLMKFAAQPDWANHLREALDDHLGPAMEAFDVGLEDLAEIIGDHWASVLWGCAFEDLATRTIEPEGRNLADDYLKRRGGTEAGPTKLYIRALRASVMSLYEVSEVEPGAGFLARDLLRGGDPAAISERSASQTLRAWDKISARVVLVGTKRVLTGGLLPFTAEAAEALIAGLRQAEGRARGNRPIGDERLREMAPLISTAWLLDTIPRALGPAPTLHNSDGEEVVFHRVRFPFARGATQALIGARLDAIPALQRENARFWNWLGARSATPRATGRLAWGVTMEDGTPVLGNVELKGRAVILAVTSAERAGRGIAFLTEALGDRVGSPLTEIETLDQAMAARRETPAEPEPSIPPEVATPLIHAMLDRHYRAALDEPVPMLGDVTPRAAARTKAGRDRLAAWLKHLENGSGRHSDPTDPMATYDLTWLWSELGIEDLRR